MVDIQLVLKPLSGDFEGEQIVIRYESPVELQGSTDEEVFQEFVKGINGVRDSGGVLDIYDQHIQETNDAHTVSEDVSSSKIAKYIRERHIDWYAEVLDWHQESEVFTQQ